MKKGFIAKGITLGCICCLLVALGACEKQETITKNATDNYVQTSGSVNDLKDLFYKKNNINEIKEDYSIKAIDGDVKTGVLVTSATKNGSLYYARPVNLDESEGAVISFELPYTDDYQTAGVEILPE